MPENTISDPAGHVFVKKQRYTDCNAVLWTVCIKWWLKIQAIHPSSIRGIVSHFIECIILEYSKTNTPFPTSKLNCVDCFKILMKVFLLKLILCYSPLHERWSLHAKDPSINSVFIK